MEAFTKWPLVGRSAEQEQLRSALTGALSGSGACQIVSGPAGIGKSRLLAGLVEEAAGLGVEVAHGRATELDQVAPLTTLLTALRTADIPALRDLTTPGDPSSNRFWLVNRLGELIEKYLTTRPLLVVVDDVQWADELSALALRFLVPTLASSPVAWVLARRPTPGDSPGQAAVDLLVKEGYPLLELQPLGHEAVTELCRHILGARPDADVLALAMRGSGNPFLLEELLLALRDHRQITVTADAATAASGELPPSFRSAVAQRLLSASETTRTLLEVGAVLGRPFTLHEAAGLLGRRPIELLPSAKDAIRSDILVDLGAELAFRHDLIREAVYGNLSGSVRQLLHREAAAVVQAEGRSSVEVAEHLIQGGRRSNAQVVEVLERAVAQLAPTAPSTAADMVTRALDLLDKQDPRRPQLAATAVRLMASAGRLTEARELGEATLRGRGESPFTTMLLLGLSEALKHAGQDGAVVSYTARALSRPDVSERERAQLLAIRAHAMLNQGGIHEARQSAQEAQQVSRSAGEQPSLVTATSALSISAQGCGEIAEAIAYSHEAVQLADTVGGEATQRHPRLWLGHALAAADRFAEAAAVYELGQREAFQLGTAWSHPVWHYHRAELWLAKGLLDDAKAEAEAGLQVAQQWAAMAMSVPLLGTLVHIAVRSGDLPEAAHLLDRAAKLSQEGTGSRVEDQVWALACYQDASKEPQVAMRTLSAFFEQLPRRLMLLVQDCSAGPRIIALAKQVGADDKAVLVLAALERLRERNPQVPSLAGAVAHARGLLHNDVAALQEAVDTYQKSPRPLAGARAKEDLATALAGRGKRRDAIALLDDALGVYLTSGATYDMARVNGRLDRIGVSRKVRRDARRVDSPWCALTQSELRVALLVAEGKINREVAAALFLSPHTVDSHLRHIFAKLGLSSRVALTRWVIENNVAENVDI
ncbi:AAA family ATPase [Streptomyces sp. NPDC047022]|uniref:helix-turn-helix transcriptional regulator n=1 Tax=Streptomyces sp. NPDC047022 TaxID=3155737 RepID=UPI0033E1E11B